MTLFEFLSAAARAGIVSSDFGTIAFRLMRRSIAAIVVVLLRKNEFVVLTLLLNLLGLFFFLYRLEKKKKPQRAETQEAEIAAPSEV